LNLKSFISKFSALHKTVLNFLQKQLPIHPYILGALLGDGGTSVVTNTISNTVSSNLLDATTIAIGRGRNGIG